MSSRQSNRQLRLEDYVVDDDYPLQLGDPTQKQKKQFEEYYGVGVDLAVIANSLGSNCLLVFIHIVKMSKKLQCFRDYVWLDPTFAQHTRISQRVIRNCARKLESAGLIDVSHKKGKFIKVWLLDANTDE